MRSALRDAEVTPPADGWARLERELGPAPRISVLRSQWPRIAAAAAAVLNIISVILVILSAYSVFIEKDTSSAIIGFVGAFLMSPYGLPALADWLIGKLDGLNESLKGFIAN